MTRGLSWALLYRWMTTEEKRGRVKAFFPASLKPNPFSPSESSGETSFVKITKKSSPTFLALKASVFHLKCFPGY